MVRLILLGFLFFLCSKTEVIYWNEASNGNWNDFSKFALFLKLSSSQKYTHHRWSGGRVPNLITDTASFQKTGSYRVFLNQTYQINDIISCDGCEVAIILASFCKLEVKLFSLSSASTISIYNAGQLSIDGSQTTYFNSKLFADHGLICGNITFTNTVQANRSEFDGNFEFRGGLLLFGITTFSSYSFVISSTSQAHFYNSTIVDLHSDKTIANFGHIKIQNCQIQQAIYNYGTLEFCGTNSYLETLHNYNKIDIQNNPRFSVVKLHNTSNVYGNGTFICNLYQVIDCWIGGVLNVSVVFEGRTVYVIEGSVTNFGAICIKSANILTIDSSVNQLLINRNSLIFDGGIIQNISVVNYGKYSFDGETNWISSRLINYGRSEAKKSSLISLLGSTDSLWENNGNMLFTNQKTLSNIPITNSENLSISTSSASHFSEIRSSKLLNLGSALNVGSLVLLNDSFLVNFSGIVNISSTFQACGKSNSAINTMKTTSTFISSSDFIQNNNILFRGNVKGNGKRVYSNNNNNVKFESVNISNSEIHLKDVVCTFSETTDIQNGAIIFIDKSQVIFEHLANVIGNGQLCVSNSKIQVFANSRANIETNFNTTNCTIILEPFSALNLLHSSNLFNTIIELTFDSKLQLQQKVQIQGNFESVGSGQLIFKQSEVFMEPFSPLCTTSFISSSISFDKNWTIVQNNIDFIDVNFLGHTSSKDIYLITFPQLGFYNVINLNKVNLINYGEIDFNGTLSLNNSIVINLEGLLDFTCSEGKTCLIVAQTTSDRISNYYQVKFQGQGSFVISIYLENNGEIQFLSSSTISVYSELYQNGIIQVSNKLQLVSSEFTKNSISTGDGIICVGNSLSISSDIDVAISMEETSTLQVKSTTLRHFTKSVNLYKATLVTASNCTFSNDLNFTESKSYCNQNQLGILSKMNLNPGKNAFFACNIFISPFSFLNAFSDIDLYNFSMLEVKHQTSASFVNSVVTGFQSSSFNNFGNISMTSSSFVNILDNKPSGIILANKNSIFSLGINEGTILNQQNLLEFTELLFANTSVVKGNDISLYLCQIGGSFIATTHIIGEVTCGSNSFFETLYWENGQINSLTNKLITISHFHIIGGTLISNDANFDITKSFAMSNKIVYLFTSIIRLLNGCASSIIGSICYSGTIENRGNLIAQQSTIESVFINYNTLQIIGETYLSSGSNYNLISLVNEAILDIQGTFTFYSTSVVNGINGKLNCISKCFVGGISYADLYSSTATSSVVVPIKFYSFGNFMVSRGSFKGSSSIVSYGKMIFLNTSNTVIISNITINMYSDLFWQGTNIIGIDNPTITMNKNSTFHINCFITGNSFKYFKLQNYGTISFVPQNNVTVEFTQDIQNFGYFFVGNGSLHASSLANYAILYLSRHGTLSVDDISYSYNGTIYGNGMISPLIQFRMLSPTVISPGEIGVPGILSFVTTCHLFGIYEISLEGIIGGENYDQIYVNGKMFVTNSLFQITRKKTFWPQIGNTFAIAFFTTRFGTFVPEYVNLDPQVILVHYYSSNVTLEFIGCPFGTYNIENCTFCNFGEYFIASNSSCGLCKPGTYTNKINQTECELCPIGSYSEIGASKCIECSPGTFSNVSGSPFCYDCPLGTYQNLFGQSFCLPCNPGTFSDGFGSKNCKTCGFFSIQEDYGSDSCINCTDKIANENHTICIECEIGTIINYTLEQCVGCNSGTYFSNRSCLKCEIGTYSISEGSLGCTNCSTNTYQNETGSSKCENCKENYYSNEGSTFCVPCTSGTQRKNSSSICTPCEIGFYNNKSGSNCIECPLETTTFSIGNSECTHLNNSSVGNSFVRSSPLEISSSSSFVLQIIQKSSSDSVSTLEWIPLVLLLLLLGLFGCLIIFFARRHKKYKKKQVYKQVVSSSPSKPLFTVEAETESEPTTPSRSMLAVVENENLSESAVEMNPQSEITNSNHTNSEKEEREPKKEREKPVFPDLTTCDNPGVLFPELPAIQRSESPLSDEPTTTTESNRRSPLEQLVIDLAEFEADQIVRKTDQQAIQQQISSEQEAISLIDSIPGSGFYERQLRNKNLEKLNLTLQKLEAYNRSLISAQENLNRRFEEALAKCDTQEQERLRRVLEKERERAKINGLSRTGRYIMTGMIPCASGNDVVDDKPRGLVL